ncbi:hypothetical protein IZ6_12340 [Terrihabitans soli]|uniref:Glycosyltransferase RgtA/B/C/D-like domain-containing protein n=1 Tax=Terrihabitans soli TaxID=708113 RepID=A0A6S6QNG6_9HYPH|nr:glycosyltransferase family 39 protein [Terrihabitans soli]BCJ90499.1 hypothetical protein IZ6_12340 [Terrihabitans soli]
MTSGGQGPRRGVWFFADWALDRLGSLKAIAVFWTVYAAVFALLRLARSSFLPFDDAISAEATQHVLLPAYSARNPPLYEWFLWAVQEITGPGVAGHIILRSVLLVVIGVLMFDTVRSLSRDTRLAAAASVSLLAFYAFTWQVHIALTQSLFVFICLLLMIRLLDSFCRKPGALRALGLGLSMGCGILAKWSFVLPAAAAFIVLLLDPRARRAGVGYFLLIIAACVIPVLPTAVFFMEARADLAGASERILLRDGADTHIGRVLQGLSGVILKTAAFFVPFLVFVIAAYARLRVRPRYATGDQSAGIVTRFIVVQALVLFAAIVIVGIANVTERYVYTLAVPMMIAFWLSMAVPPVRETLTRFVVNGAFLSLAVVLLIKIGLVLEAMIPGGRVISEVVPYPALARELEARGYGAGGIVTPDRLFSGNLVELLPEASVVAAVSDRLLPPKTYSPDETCIVIWEVEPRERWRPNLLDASALASAQRLEIVGSNGGIGAPRRGVWNYVDLGRNADVCRREIGVR